MIKHPESVKGSSSLTLQDGDEEDAAEEDVEGEEDYSDSEGEEEVGFAFVAKSFSFCGV